MAPSSACAIRIRFSSRSMTQNCLTPPLPRIPGSARLIERIVRQAMIRDGIEPLAVLPEAREARTPTTARFLEMFSDVCWSEFKRGGETVAFPIQISELQKQLLRLLDIDRPLAYA